MDFKDPLVFPQERPVSMRVARGLSGFLSRWCRVLGPPLELRPEHQSSSPVLTWVSGLLWSLNRVVRPHLVWRHASLLFSLGVQWCQASCTVDIGICGFLSRCHKAVTLAIVFESILVVTVESGRGILCTCRGLGHRGMLEWWNDHWSSFSLSI